MFLSKTFSNNRFENVPSVFLSMPSAMATIFRQKKLEELQEACEEG
jgi:hypothetical protein